MYAEAFIPEAKKPKLQTAAIDMAGDKNNEKTISKRTRASRGLIVQGAYQSSADMGLMAYVGRKVID